MRNEFVTNFWREAHQSLPAQLRPRYRSEMLAAEQWELAIGRLIEILSAAKNALVRLFQAPRSAL